MYINKNHVRLRRLDTREVKWFKKGDKIEPKDFNELVINKLCRTGQLVEDKKNIGVNMSKKDNAFMISKYPNKKLSEADVKAKAANKAAIATQLWKIERTEDTDEPIVDDTNIDMSSLTVAQLKEKAKALEITGISNMTKPQLLAALAKRV